MRQAQYTPFQMPDTFEGQGLSNSGQGKSGLVGGLVKNYVSNLVGGIIGDSSQTAGSGGTSAAAQQNPLGQMQQQSGQSQGYEPFGGMWDYAKNNSIQGTAANWIGQQAGWWE